MPDNIGTVRVKFHLVPDESHAMSDNVSLSLVNSQIVLDNARTFSPKPLDGWHFAKAKCVSAREGAPSSRQLLGAFPIPLLTLNFNKEEMLE